MSLRCGGPSLLLWVAIVLGGCGRGPQGAAPVPSAAAAPVESGPSSSTSAYALSMTLTDQDGVRSGLDVYRGHPVLIGMFYSRCPSACPLLISTVKEIDRALAPSAREQMRVLLVSFDAEHDVPEVLRATIQSRHLDARWKLASAPDDEVRDMAALLGISYRKLPDGNFSHTSSIVLLDREGNMAARTESMGAIDGIASAVTQALR